MKMIRTIHPLQNLREWDALMGDPFRLIPTLFNASMAGGRGAPAYRNPIPRVDWHEDDASWHARIELPGVKRENLRLEAEEGLLRVSYERVSGSGVENRTEPSGFVLRCPEGIRTEGIEASLADGILAVTLPKEEARKPVSIEVR